MKHNFQYLQKTKPSTTRTLKTNNIMKISILSIFCLFCHIIGFSKETQTTISSSDSILIKKEDSLAVSPQTEEPRKKGAFSFSGYVDAYYSTNFNKPLSQRNVGTAGTARVFDQRADQFALGLAQTVVKYTNQRSEVVVDLVFGPNADLANYANLGTALAIKQAYFKYDITEKWSATIGQFGTHIGYEVIDAPVNFNYSLSNLFGMGPFYHTGLKSTYAFSEKASLMLGVVNAVDGFGDNNRKKGIIGQFFISPAKDWSIYLNAIRTNDENPSSSGVVPVAYYQMLDLATTYQVSDHLLFGLNAAIGSQQLTDSTGAKPWGGVAGYVNYAITEHIGIGARYEYFDNSSGARALLDFQKNGTSVNSLTITGNVTLAEGHILVKPEFRLDAYAKRPNGAREFEDTKGAFTHNNQSTLGVAFIYKF